MTSALRWGGDQHHAPAALPPGKTRYPLYRRLGGPQGRSGRVRKISSPTGNFLFTFSQITNSVEQSFLRSWHVLSQSTIYPHYLWKPKVHYRNHPTPVCALSQINLLYASPSHFYKIHFNIIPHLSLGFSSGLFPLGLPTQILYATLPSPMRATRTALLIPNLATRIIFVEEQTL